MARCLPAHGKRAAALAVAALVSLLLPAVHAGSLLIRNATVHTVSGPVLGGASVLVRDGRIAEVGQVAAVNADATVDAAGLHLFPGLIALNTTLGLTEIDAVRATRDSTEVGGFRPDVYAWVAIHPDSELIPVARANGYTHVQAVPLGGVVSGHSAVLQLSGWTTEDFAFRKAAALHVFWPSFALDHTPKERAGSPEQWKSPEDQIRDRDAAITRLDAFFAEAEAYAATRKSQVPILPGDSARRPDPGASTDPTTKTGSTPAWDAMLPVIRGECPVFLHADGAREIRSAAAWAARRKLRAVIAGGRDAWQVADELARLRIPVAFDHVHTLPTRDHEPYDVHFRAPGILAKAGVQVSFAGDLDRFGASNIRNIPYSASQAVAFGLSEEEALRGLTLNPAQALGIANRVGSLEPGKDATFFLATGDIMDLRSQVVRLWIEGRETSLESRHTRLYERYRRRPAPTPSPDR